MKRILWALSLGLFVSIAAPGALAITITSASPAWVLVATPGAATWVLPADLNAFGCGAENEPICEPTGVFYGDTAWSGIPSYISMTDPDGSFGDIITFDSLGPGGVFRVQFYSDPNPGAFAPPDGYFQFTNVAEDSTGAISAFFPICCELTGVSVSVASDGEGPFSPYGVTFDTSDGISFQGALAAPEPATLALLGAALAGLGFSRRRRSN